MKYTTIQVIPRIRCEQKVDDLFKIQKPILIIPKSKND